jgi:hypothetical protein
MSGLRTWILIFGRLLPIIVLHKNSEAKFPNLYARKTGRTSQEYRTGSDRRARYNKSCDLIFVKGHFRQRLDVQKPVKV